MTVPVPVAAVELFNAVDVIDSDIDPVDNELSIVVIAALPPLVVAAVVVGVADVNVVAVVVDVVVVDVVDVVVIVVVATAVVVATVSVVDCAVTSVSPSSRSVVAPAKTLIVAARQQPAGACKGNSGLDIITFVGNFPLFLPNIPPRLPCRTVAAVSRIFPPFAVRAKAIRSNCPQHSVSFSNTIICEFDSFSYAFGASRASSTAFGQKSARATCSMRPRAPGRTWLHCAVEQVQTSGLKRWLGARMSVPAAHKRRRGPQSACGNVAVRVSGEGEVVGKRPRAN